MFINFKYGIKKGNYDKLIGYANVPYSIKGQNPSDRHKLRGTMFINSVGPICRFLEEYPGNMATLNQLLTCGVVYPHRQLEKAISIAWYHPREDQHWVATLDAEQGHRTCEIIPVSPEYVLPRSSLLVRLDKYRDFYLPYRAIA